MMDVQVARWGNSLGVRIPREVARQAGLAEGSRVTITTEGNRIILTTIPRRYVLEELLEGMTPAEMHEAFDWGPDLGREDVP
jgi:antitoxin MazE